MTDAVDALLDRSVGAEEYVIRAAAEGIAPDPLIDLSQIDFDGLSARFAGRKRAETDRLATLLKRRAVASARRNPTRFELVDRIEELIAEYNAGSLNSDEYLRRLISLSDDLSAEERRAVAEDMTEEELAVFDLLTKPQPVLDDVQREAVKAGAKRLLAHLHDKLVLDWRRKAATTAEVRTTILDVLDADLPAEPYPPDLFDAKVQAVFDHIVSAYGDDGSSVYAHHDVEGQRCRTEGLLNGVTPPSSKLPLRLAFLGLAPAFRNGVTRRRLGGVPRVLGRLGPQPLVLGPQPFVVSSQGLVPLRQLDDQLDQLGVAEPDSVAGGHRGHTALAARRRCGVSGDEI